MEKSSLKKLNNKGFSLVELIVVILIMGIVAGGITVSVSVIYNANIKNASERFVQMCEKARAETIGSQDDSVRLSVYKKEGNYYADVIRKNGNGRDEVTASEKLGNSQFNIYYISRTEEQESLGNESGAEKIYITSAEDDGSDSKLVIYFNRSSGGMLPQSGNGTGHEKYVTDVCMEGSEFTDIILIHETGRVLMDY